MSELVAPFQEVEGADLRIIAELDGVNYEIEYLRDDLEGLYNKDDLDTARQNIMANQVSSTDFGKVASLGDFTGQVLLFEEVIVFLFPTERYGGIFASYDRHDSLPIQEVITQATEHFNVKPMEDSGSQ